MKVGLFFGSFNPIHVGHLIIADFMATDTDLDQVWFIVSPQNPFKKRNSLANEYDRLAMVDLAIEGNGRLKSSDIEFAMPKPSYTIDTLTYLKEKYPKNEFVLIMGGDNLLTLHKWKNYERIVERHPIYLYKRPSYDIKDVVVVGAKIQSFDAPMMSISSTMIRNRRKERKSVKYLVHEEVERFMDDRSLYQR